MLNLKKFLFSEENKLVYFIGYIYFLTMVVLLFSTLFQIEVIRSFVAHLNIPILMILYFFTSPRKDILYFITLLFATLSTILFAKQPEIFLFYAILVFVLYRILTIIIVLRKTNKIRFFPILIGTIPFLITLLYIIFLTYISLEENLYSAIASAVLVSLLAGISISNYIIEENIKNTWLLISSFLFVALVFIYLIEKYFIFDSVFPLLRIICFTVGHFLFYKYVILDEKSHNY